MRRLTVASAVCIAVLGCSQLDLQLDCDEELAPGGLPSAAEQPYLRARRLAEALAQYEADRPEAAGDYLIGPGDVLEISVFALEKPDETTVLERVVSRSGHITLPWVGAIETSGLSQWQAEQSIVAAYSQDYIRSPQVMVNVAEHSSAPVVLTGAVKTPGIFPLTTNSCTVLEMLARAGGLSEDAGDELILIRADQPGSAEAVEPAERIVSIDMKQLLGEGNLALNAEVRGGDILTVPARTEDYVYVLGYVRQPGVYKLKGDMRVDALRAVALGGGLLPSARADNSYLVRATRSGQQTVRLDLTGTADQRQPVYLEPGDTLVVGSSRTARLAEIIRPSMGASLSASANVIP